MITDNFIRNGWVRRVIDGDTIEVVVDGGHKNYSIQKLRLNLVDAPEMRGSTKELGLQTKKFVEEALPVGSEIVIVSHSSDSFGRWLADVYYIDKEGKQINLSNELLERGLGILFKD